MTDLARLRTLITDGSDDRAATRALSILLGALYEMQPISNQGGGFREVQVKAPSCGYVALDNSHIAFRALENLGVCWTADCAPDDHLIIADGVPYVRHNSLARAVWLAVVDVMVFCFERDHQSPKVSGPHGAGNTNAALDTNPNVGGSGHAR